MKLLFDQNISHRVIKQLHSVFPEAKRVRELGLENKSDKQIWNFAKENQYTIATFDADFYDLVMLYGHPPKLIWLRLGNTNSSSLINLFEKKIIIIQSFILDDNFKEIACLEID